MDTINGLRETLPNEYLQAYGQKNCESGNFRYMKLCEYRMAWNYLGTHGQRWLRLGSVRPNGTFAPTSVVGGLSRRVKRSGLGTTSYRRKPTTSRTTKNTFLARLMRNLDRAAVGTVRGRAVGSWCGITWKQPNSRADFRGWSCGLSQCDVPHAP
mgnify:CR=1 FL=1